MVWMSLGSKIFWDNLVPFLHSLRNTSAAGVVIHSEHSLLLERKYLKYNHLSLPTLTHTARKVSLKDFGWLCSWTFCTNSRTTSACVTQCGICLQGVCTHTHPWPLAPSAWIIARSPHLLQSTQYYDMRWSCEHLIMVWINAFVMLTTQLLPSKYCDLLHKSAAHLGKWQKLEHGSYSNAPQHMWVGWRKNHVATFLHAAEHVYLLCVSFLFLALNMQFLVFVYMNACHHSELNPGR